MPLTCPHCQSPVETAADARPDEILCTACGPTFRIAADETLTWGVGGRRSIGRFELIERVGVGAFGTVYKARDPQPHRTVAVKVPRSGNLLEPGDLERFLREARSSARLRIRRSCRSMRWGTSRRYLTSCASSSRV